MQKSANVNWAALTTRKLSTKFQSDLQAITNGRILTVKTEERVYLRSGEFQLRPISLTKIADYLSDESFSAVLILAAPTERAALIIKAAEKGKHILCSGPIGISAAEVEMISEIASSNRVFIGEICTYSTRAILDQVTGMLKSDVLGNAEIIKINSQIIEDFDNILGEDKLYDLEAGESLIDLGYHAVEMARQIASAKLTAELKVPIKVVSVADIGEQRGKIASSALLEFHGGAIAELSCVSNARIGSLLDVLCSAGRIVVDSPRRSREGNITLNIRLFINDGEPEVISFRVDDDSIAQQLELASQAILSGNKGFIDFINVKKAEIYNFQVLDRWRKSIDLAFQKERYDGSCLTIRGERLCNKAYQKNKAKLDGLSKNGSQVALGLLEISNYPAAAILLDEYFESGGNYIDTAFEYGGGRHDRLIGQWMSSRGVRGDTILIAKGAHSPLCYPEIIGPQLAESLDRLRTDYVDVYLMHRDNPNVPVGEFVDAIDEQITAGLIRGKIGGSNWTRGRMDEAIAYASRSGKTKFSAISNNFSLAKMIQPVWPGCVSLAEDGWLEWLCERGVTNFAWSSQARGFFAKQSFQIGNRNHETLQPWKSVQNFRRRRRAHEIARNMGRDPVQIALAYVLAHAPHVIPIIGPRTVSELKGSLAAVKIELSPAEISWLEGP